MLALVVVFAVAGDTPGGWPELFPALGNFDRKVNPPVMAKGEKPATYSQSTRYEWMGGRFEILTITIARDPKFKDLYNPDVVTKLKPAPSSIEVNKKPAYLWENLTKPDNLVNVNKRLVVRLTDDKILTVEQVGFGLELDDVAKKLDFEKVIKALESPPLKK
jgi:hypothetical protein